MRSFIYNENCILPIELVANILYKIRGLEHPLAKIIKNMNEIILSNSIDNKFNYFNLPSLTEGGMGEQVVPPIYHKL